MDTKKYDYAKKRVFRLPDEEAIRRRLEEKCQEYDRRRQRYIRKHQVDGYGVLIGNDTRLLDAHYKLALFGALLDEGIVRTTDIYARLKRTFHGYIDDIMFHNAVQVLSDYLSTGGTNTSGGSGFIDKKVFFKVLDGAGEIRLPHDSALNRKLRKKYHEYLGRIAEHDQHPEMQTDRSVLERDAYKAHIIDTLRQRGSVDIETMAFELEEKFKGRFRYRHFLQAAAVIRNYCQNDHQRVVGGTGL